MRCWPLSKPSAVTSVSVRYTREIDLDLMTSLNPPLSKDDFISSHWQDVIESSERKACPDYRNAFQKKAQEAKLAGNIREQAVFEILAHVVYYDDIKSESTEQFFIETLNLTDEHLGFLTEIAAEVSDPELQARIADILWVRRRNYQMAQLAVNAYIESAKTLEDPKEWTFCFNRIERALRLAHKIKYAEDTVIRHIEAVLERYNGEDPLWLSAKLMKLLQEFRRGDSTKYSALAGKAATLAESANGWRRARDYWTIKAKWHLREKDSEKERAASMLAAETYVMEAEDALKRKTPSYLAASRFMQQAVEAFRKIRGTKEETIEAKARAEEVHKLLLQYQEESLKELVTHSHATDISDLAEHARAHVRGKDLQDALFALSLLGSPSNVSQLRKQVQEQAHESPLYHVLSPTVMNEMGKVVAHRTVSVLSSNLDEAEEATRFEMNKNASRHQSFHAQAYIEPAKEQINLEHSVQIDDLLAVLVNSPFIPPDREYLFAKGLYAGLVGDFFTSTHILIPQVENSIRYLLWRRGIITSGLDDSGIQNEYNLNSTLYHPELGSIFDENTLFDLKCLLVERSGSNLRNRMAHGLISDNEFSSPLMSYLWWFTLRLCCLPILIHQQKVEQSDPWVKFAGMFKDDPLFDEFVEDMAAYRREIDAEVTAHEIASEEHHSA
jgi:Domain of unknown function (DUF4209)